MQSQAVKTQALFCLSAKSWRFVSFGRSFNFQERISFNPFTYSDRGTGFWYPFLKKYFFAKVKSAENALFIRGFGSKRIFNFFWNPLKNGAKFSIMLKRSTYDMIGDGMYFSDLTHTLQKISKDERALFISGQPGSGKTFMALQFCAEHKNSTYFSFQNLDILFALRVFCNAYPDILKNCENWLDFFHCLNVYSNKKRLLVFFDNAGERNDKDDFYAALNDFLKTDSTVTVVILGRSWEAPPIPCRKVEINFFSMPQLADIGKLPDKTAASLYCLTGAIPALLSLYNNEISFEENVKAMLHTNSPFYRLAIEWMRESFRTPESYNILLYAMANGYNRIGEIAKFSGFPKNKCDKYIKALIEHGLVIKIPGENGHTKYLPANTYLTLWYRFLLTAVPSPNGNFDDDIFNQFMQYFNNALMADFYRDMCHYWLEKNINANTPDYIDAKNTAYHDIAIGDITFDFACQGNRNVYAYFDTIADEGLSINLWKEIDAVTTKTAPFYKNEYYICTVNRVPDSYWKLSKTYDNVHVVSSKMLFAEYKKEYNSWAHKRFVPSFVRRRG